MSDSKKDQSDQYKGWLSKWTNYLKGYQKRWFVLQNGLLSYYRNQAEMAHTCRGTINLANAFIHTEDSCCFVISNGGTRTFHLKAANEVERQQWVTALELAKSKKISLVESDDEEEEGVNCPDQNELLIAIRLLNSKLEDLNTCNNVIIKHGQGLQKAINDLEQVDMSSDITIIKSVNERAALFKITTNAMIKACGEYLDLAQTQGKRWQKLLQYEHDQRMRLEEMVEQLAKQHSSFEQQAKKTLARQNHGTPIPTTKAVEGETVFNEDDEEDDFFDAVDDHKEEFKMFNNADKSHKRTGSGISVDSISAQLAHDSSDSEIEKPKDISDINNRPPYVRSKSVHSRTSNNENDKSEISDGLPNGVVIPKAKRKRRKMIPEKPNYSINLWSIMKNSIGKELSKIPMPVNFNEPLSFLQRLTEDFEYSEILDTASTFDDPCEQLVHLAAFTVSAFATTTVRTAKPFNPLLGETYECDRTDDKGWRSIAEQVSHHPPVIAQFTESNADWHSWHEFTMSSKFRGKYLQIIPLGTTHIKFLKSGNHYTFRKVNTTVHNIIVGTLWVDNHGDMEIVNHKTGDVCHVKYNAYSYFSKEVPRRVTGVVNNSEGVTKWILQGTWDEKIECAKVTNVKDNVKGKTVYETEPAKLIWQRKYPPPELKSRYNFTEFAITLNEEEEGVAPTDSRLRPDQRLMEAGKWDEANDIKLQLEEKQRVARRKREAEANEAAETGLPVSENQVWQPLWFDKKICSATGNLCHVYNGNYFKTKEKQDWHACPNIFL